MLPEELILLTEKEAAELLRLEVKTLQNRRYYRKPPAYIKTRSLHPLQAV